VITEFDIDNDVLELMGGIEMDPINTNTEKYKKERRYEIRENNLKTKPNFILITSLNESQRKTYNAGQLWMAFFVGLFGGTIITLIMIL